MKCSNTGVNLTHIKMYIIQDDSGKKLGTNSRSIKRKIKNGKLKDGIYHFYSTRTDKPRKVFSVEYKTVNKNSKTRVVGKQTNIKTINIK